MDLTQNESVGSLAIRLAAISRVGCSFESLDFADSSRWRLLPQLLALGHEEIGSKIEEPARRLGAIIALAAIVIYVGGRAILHGNGVAVMEARTYRRELPRRVAAFAESIRRFTGAASWKPNARSTSLI